MKKPDVFFRGFVVKLTMLTGMVMITPSSFSQSAVNVLETDTLLESPQRYWAKTVIFRDEIEDMPSSSRITIKDKDYFRFELTEIGEAYATREAVDALRELRLHRKYLFRGTVLNKGSFLGQNYYYIVNEVVEQLDDPEIIESDIGTLVGGNAADSLTPARRLLAEVIYQAQASFLVYCDENEITLETLFDPNSEHHAKLVDLVMGSLRPLEREGEMTPSMMLGQIILRAIKEHYQIVEKEALALGANRGFTDYASPDDSDVEIVRESDLPPPGVPEGMEDQWQELLEAPLVVGMEETNTITLLDQENIVPETLTTNLPPPSEVMPEANKPEERVADLPASTLAKDTNDSQVATVIERAPKAEEIVQKEETASRFETVEPVEKELEPVSTNTAPSKDPVEAVLESVEPVVLPTQADAIEVIPPSIPTEPTMSFEDTGLFSNRPSTETDLEMEENPLPIEANKGDTNQIDAVVENVQEAEVLDEPVSVPPTNAPDDKVEVLEPVVLEEEPVPQTDPRLNRKGNDPEIVKKDEIEAEKVQEIIPEKQEKIMTDEIEEPKKKYTLPEPPKRNKKLKYDLHAPLPD